MTQKLNGSSLKPAYYQNFNSFHLRSETEIYSIINTYILPGFLHSTSLARKWRDGKKYDSIREKKKAKKALLYPMYRNDRHMTTDGPVFINASVISILNSSE